MKKITCLFLANFESKIGLVVVLVVVAAVFMVLATVYIALVIRDSNKRKKLNRSNQAKERFLKYMSKEIAQPIDDVKKMLALIEINGKKENSEYVNNAKASINLLSEMIDNFKHYSALESGAVTLNEKWFTREECVCSIESMLQSLYLEKNIKLTVISSKKDHKYSKVDYPKLMQILINIVSNAIKYTPANGEIEIIAKGVNFDGTQSTLHFEVKDNGIGMSEEFLTNVFNPFERESTAENIIGSGLGLSITRYLVEIMHGTIEIKSKQNVGTTVIVDIPARATNDENVVKQDEKE